MKKIIKSKIYSSKNKPSMVFLFILLFVFLFFCLSIINFVSQKQLVFKNNNIKNQITELMQNFDFKEPPIEYLDKEIQDLNIQAKSYILYDFKNQKIVFSKEHDKSLPLASISKLMTSYIGIKYCGDIFNKYKESILLNSSNQDSDTLAKQCFNDYDVFVNFMNREVSNMNLNMFFSNSSGLDIDSNLEASNYGDAISAVMLAKAFYDYDRGDTFGLTLKTYSNTGLPNTNKYVSVWPFLIASKTGFTDMANGNLVTLYSYNQDIFAIAVLGSTKEGRFEDTYKLLNYYLSKQ